MSDYGTSPNTKNELNFDNDEPQDAFQLNFDQFNNSEAVQSRKCVRPPRRHPLPRLSSNMSLNEVEAVLSKRLCEKLGRNAPILMVDRIHVQCKVCDAIISINKKMEISNVVRHFQAWHPASHTCSGSWMAYTEASFAEFSSNGFMLLERRPFSRMDFAVVDANTGMDCKLQCLWCGVMATTFQLPNHIARFHSEEVDVPSCDLCSKELVVNARLAEKFGEDFSITMPDEHHFVCGRFNTKHTDETQLDKAIEKHMRKLHNGGGLDIEENEDEDDQDHEITGKRKSEACDAFSNSRMPFGRRSKPKRQFILPSLRQATPINSQYVEPVSECHWRCKLCNHDIFAAVISAGAIRHFRSFHQNQLKSMQFELCKTRLEHVSDGCMEFTSNNPTTVECRLCQVTFPLHRPLNICRAIAHLKAKHPKKMPEYKAEIDDRY
ncbi:hypothetical protein DdX_04710 [Ditylenchus destructor]|uniref:Uncharacterized protein n=1 Tax=Ditylenchus destructor TaxID=166010 RepID=A0AAD4RA15_9BILA|nr:hypothetical protein DdX_04710 [Ditylenchus destructor]